METTLKEQSVDMSGFTVIDMGTKELGDERKWNIESVSGYKPQTTFYQDFAIADAFGPIAVIATFAAAVDCYKNNAVYITELSMVLNHRGWMHYHAKRQGYADLYFQMWEELTQRIENEYLTGDDLDYYYRTTD